MSATKPIPGLQRGPDFEWEVHEPTHVERVQKEAKERRVLEANDPIVSAAVEAVHEMASSLNRKIDVQYERNSGMVVMTIYDSTGEEIIRRLPPEDTIRMAQNLKDQRARYLDSVF